MQKNAKANEYKNKRIPTVTFNGISFLNFFVLLHLPIDIFTRTDFIITIKADAEGSQGNWKTWVYCPDNSFAKGFRMRIDDPNASDPTGLNSIEIDCFDYLNLSRGTIISHPGDYGPWYSFEYCEYKPNYVNFMKSYRMRDGGANLGSLSMSVKCLSGFYFEPPGAFGSGWGNFAECPSGTAICGYRSRYEDYQGIFVDDSALNHVEVACCRLCDLKGGLYLSGTTCGLCHYTCKTCSGSSSSMCSSCIFPTHTLTNGVCQPPLNDYVVSAEVPPSGWLGPVFSTSNCGYINNIVGGYGNFGAGAYITKSFTNIPPYFHFRLWACLLKIDSWENELFRIYVNSILKYSSSTLNYDDNVYTSDQCGSSGFESIDTYSFEYDELNPGDIIIKIDTNLDSVSTDESWGVLSFAISVSKCHVTCKSCSNELLTSCLTCYNHATKQNDNSCLCDDTYYAVSSSPCTTNTCTQCISCYTGCRKCTGSGKTQCQSCIVGYFFNADTCYINCPLPLWGNNNTRTCETTCKEISVYGDANDRICKACDISCKTCTAGASNECLSCAAELSRFHEFPTSNTNGRCLITCNSPNKFAFFPERKCYSVCPFPTWGDIVTNYCVNSCALNQYTDFALRVCANCDPSCESCLGPTNEACLICASSFYLFGTQCKTNCGPGFYGDTLDRKCKPCDSNCKECTTPNLKNFCTSCKNPTQLLLASGICSFDCSSGYKDYNLQACKDCASSCLTCEGPLNTDCLSCPIGRYLDPETKTCKNNCLPLFGHNDGICYKTCPDPYFGDSSTYLCSLSCPVNKFKDKSGNNCNNCHSSCKECDGPTDKNCKSCFVPQYLLQNKICSTTCPDGYYGSTQDPPVCLECHSDCLTCTGPNNNNCKSCVKGSLKPYHENPLFETEGVCLSNCKENNPYGDDLNGRCYSTCPSPRWAHLETKKCVESCPVGFFGHLSTRICTACDSSCETCSGEGIFKCLSCKCLSENPYHESPVVGADGRCLGVCIAPFPYGHEFSGRCHICCPYPTFGLGTINKCIGSCPSDYFLESKTRECKKCDDSCETCSASGPQYCRTCSQLKITKYHQFPNINTDGNCLNACSSAYPYGDDDTNRCYSICPSGRWGSPISYKCETNCPLNCYKNDPTRECYICDSTCRTCSGPLNNQCLSCNSAGSNPFFEFPLEGKEGKCLSTCVQPYPYAYESQCYKICPESTWGDSNKNKCEVKCDINYYGDINRECKPCHSNCKSCSGDSSLQCLSCSGSKPYHESPITGNEGACLDICLSPNPYADDITNRCYSLCPDTRWGLSETGKCEISCPSGFYSDLTSKLCKKCHMDCYTCSAGNSNNCVSCIPGSAKPYHEIPFNDRDASCVEACSINYPYADENSGQCYLVCPQPRWGDASKKKCISNCDTGFYGDIASRVCKVCDPTCESCSYSGPSKCLKCKSGSVKLYHDSSFEGVEGSCIEICKDPNPYGDESTGRCQSICPTPNFGLLATNKCVPDCPSEYYEDTTSRKCEQCDLTCEKCSAGGPTKCRTCSSLKLTKYHEFPTLNTDGMCLSLCTKTHPYSDDNTNRCYTSCPTPLWGLAPDNKCVENCPINYFKETLTRECKVCHSACASCSGALYSQCLTCIPLGPNPYHESPIIGVDGRCLTTCVAPNPYSSDNLGRCYNICPIPFWRDDLSLKCESQCEPNFFGNSNRECIMCHTTCASCSGALETECLTCSGNINPYHESSNAGSPGKCLPICTSPYQYADDETHRCYSICPNQKWGLGTTGKCESVCPTNTFYADTTTRECKPCYNTCHTCTGGTLKDCLSCISGGTEPYHESPLIGNAGRCLVKCLDPYPYADDHTNRCYIKCPDPLWGFDLTGKCVKTCPIGYFNDILQKLCRKCDPDCESCSGDGAVNCLTCITGGAKPFHDSPIPGNSGFCVAICVAPNIFSDDVTKRCYSICPEDKLSDKLSNKCVNSCQLGYYADYPNRICKICNASCETCSGEGLYKCRTCSFRNENKFHESPDQNNDGRCLSKCSVIGLYEDLSTGRCQKVCPVPRVGVNNSMKCEEKCVSDDEYIDPVDRKCKSCDLPCKTCSSFSKCLSCYSKYDFIPDRYICDKKPDYQPFKVLTEQLIDENKIVFSLFTNEPFQIVNNQTIESLIDLNISDSSGSGEFTMKVSEISENEIKVDIFPKKTGKYKIDMNIDTLLKNMVNKKNDRLDAINNIDVKAIFNKGSLNLTFNTDLFLFLEEEKVIASKDLSKSTEVIVPVLAATSFLPLILFSNFQLFWLILDCTQIANLYLMINFEYPYTAKIFLSALSDVSYFRFIPRFITNIFKIEAKENNKFSSSFQDNIAPFRFSLVKIYSVNIFENDVETQLQIIILLLLLMVFILFGLKVSKKKLRLFNIFQSADKLFRYSLVISIHNSFFIKLCILVNLQLTRLPKRDILQIASFVFAVFLKLYLFIFLFWIFRAINHIKTWLNDSTHIKEFKILLENLKSPDDANFLSRNHFLIVFVHKLLLCEVLIWFQFSPFSQIFILIALQIVLVLYSIFCRPFAEEFDNCILISINLFNLIAQFLIFSFMIITRVIIENEQNDNKILEESIYNLSWVFCSLILFTMATTFFSHLYRIVGTLKKKSLHLKTKLKGKLNSNTKKIPKAEFQELPKKNLPVNEFNFIEISQFQPNQLNKENSGIVNHDLAIEDQKGVDTIDFSSRREESNLKIGPRDVEYELQFFEPQNNRIIEGDPFKFASSGQKSDSSSSNRDQSYLELLNDLNIIRDICNKSKNN